VNSKLPKIEDSIFSRITNLALEYDAINLGQGFPDFEPDPVLLKCVKSAIDSSKHQYAPMQGDTNLRKIISGQRELNWLPTDPFDEITITAGGTQAIFTLIASLIRPGDRVMVFEPLYDCYIPAIEVNGGIPVIISTVPPHFEIPWDEVEEKSAYCKLMIINTPGNPSGKVVNSDDYKNLERIVVNKDILILSDEVYEDIVLFDNQHLSPRGIPSLRAQSISVHSLGKSLGCTGWKIGYIVADPLITKEFRKLHQFNVFCVNSFLQAAIAEYFVLKTDVRMHLRGFYTDKYQIIRNQLDVSPIDVLETQGSFFVNVAYRGFEDYSDVEYCDLLIKKAGVAVIPLSAFYPSGAIDRGYIRLCFAKKNETLTAGIYRLLKYLI
jgi:methionine transaminase